MNRKFGLISRSLAAGAALVLGTSFAVLVNAQTPSAEGSLKAGRQAIENRKAVFTLIGSNFQPLGNVLKGASPYEVDKAQKNVARIAFLAEFLNEAFPENSNLGEPETKTKAEAWSNKADLDKRIKDFQAHALALVQVNATEKGATDAFKAAVTTLGQDCKGCHDNYKAK